MGGAVARIRGPRRARLLAWTIMSSGVQSVGARFLAHGDQPIGVARATAFVAVRSSGAAGK
jgi:hypothetical protein